MSQIVRCYIAVYQITQCPDSYRPNYTVLDTKKNGNFDSKRLEILKSPKHYDYTNGHVRPSYCPKTQK